LYFRPLTAHWRGLLGLASALVLAGCGGTAAPAASSVAPASAAAKPASAAPASASAGSAAKPAASGAAVSSGADPLADLVKAANQEGQLIATIQSSWDEALIPQLSDAFKKRFGLNINVSLNKVASAQHFPVAVGETKAGTPPTYDVVQGDDTETMQLTGGGGVQKIDNWQALLAAVNPAVKSGTVKASQISSGPFEGASFLSFGNIKQILYNPKLISADQLPKTHQDLTDLRYKGKFNQPPWTAQWEIAPQVMDPAQRDKWLDVVRAAGKNGGEVLFENIGVQRVVLGQYQFALAQETYVRQTLAKDPQAPIAAAYFNDYQELNGVYYSVRTKARHPAAATLWALWMTTPEAEGIWQPNDKDWQPYGSSDIDKTVDQSVKDAKAPLVGFLDNDKTIALLNFYATPAGESYLEAMAKAIKGQ